MKELIETAEKLGYSTPSITDCDNFSKNIELYEEELNYVLLCLIQKWLREEKKIWIEVSVLSSICYFYDIIKVKKYELIFQSEEYFNNPHQALEEGIKNALEILEK